MKCPYCGAASSVEDSRPAADLTYKRTRLCGNGHRFKTLEVHHIVYSTVRHRVKDYARIVAERVKTRNQDKFIAMNLHKGWEKLATQFGINKTTVYRRAKRGRRT